MIVYHTHKTVDATIIIQKVAKTDMTLLTKQFRILKNF